jgi:nitrogen regulatory protein P-II 1
MKEIKAYVRPSKIEAVIEELRGAGARDMTAIRVDAIGPMADSDAEKHHLLRMHREKYSAIAKLEIVCSVEEAPRFCDVILVHAHTGAHGDGRIFVTPVERAVNIRTGSEGKEAL